SPDYTVYLNSLHLRGRFEEEATRKALDTLAARHPILRTSIDAISFSEPLQIVHRLATLPLKVEDLRDIPAAEREGRIGAWIEEEKRRKFDWSHAPLFRFHAHLRDEASFQLTMSEPFLDGWSVGTLLIELFTRYFVLLEGDASSGEPPPTALYRDFVALEREAMASPECRRYLESVVSAGEPTRLPRPEPRPQDLRPDVSRIDLPIPAEVTDGLKRLARSEGVAI